MPTATRPGSKPQRPLPLVDVFICTYNEEEAILERTIIGALSMDYPRYRVWVLDDGRRAWLEALCERLGSGYLTRPDNAHAKAGNINNGLAPRRGPGRAARLHQHSRCRLRADAAVPAPRAQPVSRGRRRHRADAAALHQRRPAADQSVDGARLARRAALFLRRGDGVEGCLGRLLLLRHVLGHSLSRAAADRRLSRRTP